MFDKVVANLLTAHLGQYFENIDKQQVKVSIWNGKVHLQKLKVRTDALRFTDLPVCVKEGTIGSLTVIVPWTRLQSEPVVVEIADVVLVVHLKKSVAFNAAQERMELRERRDRQLMQFEMQLQRERTEAAQSPSPSSPPTAEADADAGSHGLTSSSPPAAAHTIPSDESEKKDNTFSARLKAAILNNVKIVVKRVVVRYEDKSVNRHSGEVVSATVKLNQFTTFACDNNYKAAFTPAKDRVLFKRASIDGLQVFAGFDRSSQADLSGEELLRLLFGSSVATESEKKSSVAAVPNATDDQEAHNEDAFQEIESNSSRSSHKQSRSASTEPSSHSTIQQQQETPLASTARPSKSLLGASFTTSPSSPPSLPARSHASLTQISEPMSVDVRVRHQPIPYDVTIPTWSFFVNISRSAFSLSRESWDSIWRCAHEIQNSDDIEAFRQFRPAGDNPPRPTENPRLWWKFALDCVVYEVRKARRAAHFNWEEYRSMKTKRDEYVTLHKRLEASKRRALVAPKAKPTGEKHTSQLSSRFHWLKPLSEAEVSQHDNLELDLPLEIVKVGRRLSYARLELEREQHDIIASNARSAPTAATPANASSAQPGDVDASGGEGTQEGLQSPLPTASVAPVPNSGWWSWVAVPSWGSRKDATGVASLESEPESQIEAHEIEEMIQLMSASRWTSEQRRAIAKEFGVSVEELEDTDYGTDAQDYSTERVSRQRSGRPLGGPSASPSTAIPTALEFSVAFHYVGLTLRDYDEWPFARFTLSQACVAATRLENKCFSLAVALAAVTLEDCAPKFATQQEASSGKLNSFRMNQSARWAHRRLLSTAPSNRQQNSPTDETNDAEHASPVNALIASALESSAAPSAAGASSGGCASPLSAAGCVLSVYVDKLTEERPVLLLSERTRHRPPRPPPSLHSPHRSNPTSTDSQSAFDAPQDATPLPKDNAATTDERTTVEEGGPMEDGEPRGKQHSVTPPYRIRVLVNPIDVNVNAPFLYKCVGFWGSRRGRLSASVQKGKKKDADEKEGGNASAGDVAAGTSHEPLLSALAITVEKEIVAQWSVTVRGLSVTVPEDCYEEKASHFSLVEVRVRNDVGRKLAKLSRFANGEVGATADDWVNYVFVTIRGLRVDCSYNAVQIRKAVAVNSLNALDESDLQQQSSSAPAFNDSSLRAISLAGEDYWQEHERLACVHPFDLDLTIKKNILMRKQPDVPQMCVHAEVRNDLQVTCSHSVLSVLCTSLSLLSDLMHNISRRGMFGEKGIEQLVHHQPGVPTHAQSDESADATSFVHSEKMQLVYVTNVAEQFVVEDDEVMTEQQRHYFSYALRRTCTNEREKLRQLKRMRQENAAMSGSHSLSQSSVSRFPSVAQTMFNTAFTPAHCFLNITRGRVAVHHAERPSLPQYVLELIKDQVHVRRTEHGTNGSDSNTSDGSCTLTVFIERGGLAHVGNREELREARELLFTTYGLPYLSSMPALRRAVHALVQGSVRWEPTPNQTAKLQLVPLSKQEKLDIIRAFHVVSTAAHCCPCIAVTIQCSSVAEAVHLEKRILHNVCAEGLQVAQEEKERNLAPLQHTPEAQQKQVLVDFALRLRRLTIDLHPTDSIVDLVEQYEQKGEEEEDHKEENNPHQRASTAAPETSSVEHSYKAAAEDVLITFEQRMFHQSVLFSGNSLTIVTDTDERGEDATEEDPTISSSRSAHATRQLLSVTRVHESQDAPPAGTSDDGGSAAFSIGFDMEMRRPLPSPKLTSIVLNGPVYLAVGSDTCVVIEFLWDVLAICLNQVYGCTTFPSVPWCNTKKELDAQIQAAANAGSSTGSHDARSFLHGGGNGVDTFVKGGAKVDLFYPDDFLSTLRERKAQLEVQRAAEAAMPPKPGAPVTNPLYCEGLFQRLEAAVANASKEGPLQLLSLGFTDATIKWHVNDFINETFLDASQPTMRLCTPYDEPFWKEDGAVAEDLESRGTSNPPGIMIAQPLFDSPLPQATDENETHEKPHQRARFVVDFTMHKKQFQVSFADSLLLHGDTGYTYTHFLYLSLSNTKVNFWMHYLRQVIEGFTRGFLHRTSSLVWRRPYIIGRRLLRWPLHAPPHPPYAWAQLNKHIDLFNVEAALLHDGREYVAHTTRAARAQQQQQQQQGTGDGRRKHRKAGSRGGGVDQPVRVWIVIPHLSVHDEFVLEGAESSQSPSGAPSSRSPSSEPEFTAATSSTRSSFSNCKGEIQGALGHTPSSTKQGAAGVSDPESSADGGLYDPSRPAWTVESFLSYRSASRELRNATLVSIDNSSLWCVTRPSRGKKPGESSANSGSANKGDLSPKYTVCAHNDDDATPVECTVDCVSITFNIHWELMCIAGRCGAKRFDVGLSNYTFHGTSQQLAYVLDMVHGLFMKYPWVTLYPPKVDDAPSPHLNYRTPAFYIPATHSSDSVTAPPFPSSQITPSEEGRVRTVNEWHIGMQSACLHLRDPPILYRCAVRAATFTSHALQSQIEPHQTGREGGGSGAGAAGKKHRPHFDLLEYERAAAHVAVCLDDLLISLVWHSDGSFVSTYRIDSLDGWDLSTAPHHVPTKISASAPWLTVDPRRRGRAPLFRLHPKEVMNETFRVLRIRSDGAGSPGQIDLNGSSPHQPALLASFGWNFMNGKKSHVFSDTRIGSIELALFSRFLFNVKDTFLSMRVRNSFGKFLRWDPRRVGQQMEAPINAPPQEWSTQHRLQLASLTLNIVNPGRHRVSTLFIATLANIQLLKSSEEFGENAQFVFFVNDVTNNGVVVNRTSSTRARTKKDEQELDNSSSGSNPAANLFRVTSDSSVALRHVLIPQNREGTQTAKDMPSGALFSLQWSKGDGLVCELASVWIVSPLKEEVAAVQRAWSESGVGDLRWLNSFAEERQALRDGLHLVDLTKPVALEKKWANAPEPATVEDDHGGDVSFTLWNPCVVFAEHGTILRDPVAAGHGAVLHFGTIRGSKKRLATATATGVGYEECYDVTVENFCLKSLYEATHHLINPMNAEMRARRSADGILHLSASVGAITINIAQEYYELMLHSFARHFLVSEDEGAVKQQKQQMQTAPNARSGSASSTSSNQKARSGGKYSGSAHMPYVPLQDQVQPMGLSFAAPGAAANDAGAEQKRQRLREEREIAEQVQKYNKSGLIVTVELESFSLRVHNDDVGVIVSLGSVGADYSKSTVPFTGDVERFSTATINEDIFFAPIVLANGDLADRVAKLKASLTHMSVRVEGRRDVLALRAHTARAEDSMTTATAGASSTGAFAPNSRSSSSMSSVPPLSSARNNGAGDNVVSVMQHTHNRHSNITVDLGEAKVYLETQTIVSAITFLYTPYRQIVLPRLSVQEVTMFETDVTLTSRLVLSARRKLHISSKTYNHITINADDNEIHFLDAGKPLLILDAGVTVRVINATVFLYGKSIEYYIMAGNGSYVVLDPDSNRFISTVDDEDEYDDSDDFDDVDNYMEFTDPGASPRELDAEEPEEHESPTAHPSDRPRDPKHDEMARRTQKIARRRSMSRGREHRRSIAAEYDVHEEPEVADEEGRVGSGEADDEVNGQNEKDSPTPRTEQIGSLKSGSDAQNEFHTRDEHSKGEDSLSSSRSRRTKPGLLASPTTPTHANEFYIPHLLDSDKFMRAVVKGALEIVMPEIEGVAAVSSPSAQGRASTTASSTTKRNVSANKAATSPSKPPPPTSGSTATTRSLVIQANMAARLIMVVYKNTQEQLGTFDLNRFTAICQYLNSAGAEIDYSTLISEWHLNIGLNGKQERDAPNQDSPNPSPGTTMIRVERVGCEYTATLQAREPSITDSSLQTQRRVGGNAISGSALSRAFNRTSGIGAGDSSEEPLDDTHDGPRGRSPLSYTREGRIRGDRARIPSAGLERTASDSVRYLGGGTSGGGGPHSPRLGGLPTVHAEPGSSRSYNRKAASNFLNAPLQSDADESRQWSGSSSANNYRVLEVSTTSNVEIRLRFGDLSLVVGAAQQAMTALGHIGTNIFSLIPAPHVQDEALEFASNLKLKGQELLDAARQYNGPKSANMHNSSSASLKSSPAKDVVTQIALSLPLVSIYLVDDRTSVDLPLFHTRLENISMPTTEMVASSLKMHAAMTWALFYYDFSSSTWRSLLEPVLLDFVLRNQKNVSLEDVKARKGSLRAGLHFRSMKFHLCPTMVENLRGLLALRDRLALGLQGNETKGAATQLTFYMYRVTQHLGPPVTVNFAVDNLNRFPAQQTLGMKETFDFNFPRIEGRELAITQHYIVAGFRGSTELVNVGTSGKNVVPFGRGMNGGQVIVDVSVVNGQKVVDFRTNVTFVNALPFSVVVGGVGAVHPNENFTVPTDSLRSRTSFLPQVELKCHSCSLGLSYDSIPYLYEQIFLCSCFIEDSKKSLQKAVYFFIRFGPQAYVGTTNALLDCVATFEAPMFIVNHTGVPIEVALLRKKSAGKSRGFLTFTESTYYEHVCTVDIESETRYSVTEVDPLEDVYFDLVLRQPGGEYIGRKGDKNNRSPVLVHSENKKSRDRTITLYDQYGSTLVLHIEYSGRDITIWCPYWVVNQTSHYLQIMDSHPRKKDQQVAGLRPDEGITPNGLPFLVNTEKFERMQDNSHAYIRVGQHQADGELGWSSWSAPILINPLSDCEVINCAFDNYVVSISYSVQFIGGAMKDTRVIKFRPRWIVVNRTGSLITFRQRGRGATTGEIKNVPITLPHEHSHILDVSRVSTDAKEKRSSYEASTRSGSPSSGGNAIQVRIPSFGTRQVERCEWSPLIGVDMIGEQTFNVRYESREPHVSGAPKVTHADYVVAEDGTEHIIRKESQVLLVSCYRRGGIMYVVISKPQVPPYLIENRTNYTIFVKQRDVPETIAVYPRTTKEYVWEDESRSAVLSLWASERVNVNSKPIHMYFDPPNVVNRPQLLMQEIELDHDDGDGGNVVLYVRARCMHSTCYAISITTDTSIDEFLQLPFVQFMYQLQIDSVYALFSRSPSDDLMLLTAKPVYMSMLQGASLERRSFNEDEQVFDFSIRVIQLDDERATSKQKVVMQLVDTQPSMLHARRIMRRTTPLMQMADVSLMLMPVEVHLEDSFLFDILNFIDVVRKLCGAQSFLVQHSKEYEPCPWTVELTRSAKRESKWSRKVVFLQHLLIEQVILSISLYRTPGAENDPMRERFGFLSYLIRSVQDARLAWRRIEQNGVYDKIWLLGALYSAYYKHHLLSQVPNVVHVAGLDVMRGFVTDLLEGYFSSSVVTYTAGSKPRVSRRREAMFQSDLVLDSRLEEKGANESFHADDWELAVGSQTVVPLESMATIAAAASVSPMQADARNFFSNAYYGSTSGSAHHAASGSGDGGRGDAGARQRRLDVPGQSNVRAPHVIIPLSKRLSWDEFCARVNDTELREYGLLAVQQLLRTRSYNGTSGAPAWSPPAAEQDDGTTGGGRRSSVTQSPAPRECQRCAEIDLMRLRRFESDSLSVLPHPSAGIISWEEFAHHVSWEEFTSMCSSSEVRRYASLVLRNIVGVPKNVRRIEGSATWCIGD